MTFDLRVSDDELSRFIVALYLFCVELNLSGAGIYLDRYSADELPVVRTCFEKHQLVEGLAWLASLDAAYGMPIQVTKSEREDYIFSSEAVMERLENFDEENRATLVNLLPKVEALLDELVALRQGGI
ncbi:hypothetical protein [Andreprevotia lacus]|uniref:hypothetical protein n=1 Tax=Andreprevotia lacus TaxID=1121000 RepID=UPI00111C3877|nr:hypothetical protein [Andreprevotia lacus]